MNLEIDEHCGFRVNASCDEWWEEFDSDKNDAFGNDFGRTQWCDSRNSAIKAWNYCTVESIKTDHQDFW
jgi:hypothetical protein